MAEKIKLIGVKMPLKLADSLETIARSQYKNMSSLIREIVADYVCEELSLKEWKCIERGRREYREGKCVHWKKAING